MYGEEEEEEEEKRPQQLCYKYLAPPHNI
jgi:hypothetical protein